MPIRFGNYKFCNGINRGLESALRWSSKASMDLGILQGEKITNGIYTRGSARYSIVTTDTPRWHCGRVAVSYRPSPRYTVEAVQKCSPNVFGFQIVTGGAAIVHRRMLPCP